MNRPRALDLFCGAGGASMGIHRAGFDVTGVDIKPQPRYPFAFTQSDAMDESLWHIISSAFYDFIWASPPCQAFSLAGGGKNRANHPDLIEPIRSRLKTIGCLYCIENVPQAPLRVSICLDGGMFGLNTYRKRNFETNFAILQPSYTPAFGPLTRHGAVTVTGHPGWVRKVHPNKRFRGRWGTLAEWKSAMQIDWMTGKELAQAIPPAYSEYIARRVIDQLLRKGL